MLQEVELKKIQVVESLYPRSSVSYQHVLRLKDAIVAGAKLPPIIVDQKFRLIDGRHRLEAYSMLEIPTVTVEVRRVKDDAEFLTLAAQLNATHGRPLSPYEITEVTRRLHHEFNKPIATISQALFIPRDTLLAWLKKRTANNGRLTLKKPFATLYGGQANVPKEVVELNERSKGWTVLSVIQEAVMLLSDKRSRSEFEEILTENPHILNLVTHLADILQEVINTANERIAKEQKKQKKQKKQGGAL